jgi:hypothetical protein
MAAVKQVLILGVVLAALSACAPTVPDSGSGVGFSDYAQYELDRARREAALARGQSAPVVAPVNNSALATTGFTPAPPVQTQAIPSSDLAAAGIGTSARSNTVSSPTGLNATPGNAPPPLLNNPGISDEQEFSAVSGRETIQSDAERRAAQAAAYETIQPTAVPTRTGSSEPNIVEYAINAPNVKGQEWYSRFRFSGQGRFQRNCASYTSPDDAQIDFLRRGGPEKDPRGIDPDGDGFACGWDPAPFKLARQAGN